MLYSHLMQADAISANSLCGHDTKNFILVNFAIALQGGLLYVLYSNYVHPYLEIVIFGDQFIMEEPLRQYPRVFNGGTNGQVVLFKHTNMLRKCNRNCFNCGKKI